MEKKFIQGELKCDEDGVFIPKVGDVITFDEVEFLAMPFGVCEDCIFDGYRSHCIKVRCEVNNVHFILNHKRNE